MRQRIDLSSGLCVAVFDPHYTVMHIAGMEPKRHPVPELLQKMEDRLSGNQEALAAFIGASQPQISRWKGGAEPKMNNYLRITDAAERLGVLGDVRSEDVANTIDGPIKRTISVKGYVGAGSRVTDYKDVSPGDLDQIEASDRDTNQTVAVRILGTSLGTFFDRWYVCYDDVRSPITDDLLNQLCVVGLSDDRVLIKKVVRRGRSARFDLLSNADNEPPIENVTIEWAAKVTDLRPG